MLPKRKIVLVGGCFDILHPGHILFLKEAKKKADILYVALESDEFIKQKKHRVPFFTQKERARMLLALKSVDRVISLPLFKGYEEYLEMVRDIRPSIIAITKGDPQFENKCKMAKEVGATVSVVCNILPGKSTSSIIAHLSKM